MCKRHPNNCKCFQKGHTTNIGRKWIEEDKQKLRGPRPFFKGMPTKHNQKYPPTGLGFRKGANHPCWKGGISPLNWTIRNLNEHRTWRKQIFRRDNYICQSCGERGIKLEAHHIKSFYLLLKDFLSQFNQFSPIEDKETLTRLAIKYEPFWDLENGITLCKDCHKNTSSHHKKGSLTIPKL
jgi:5-methylcytosine-specific restriction endonuclease McrA